MVWGHCREAFEIMLAGALRLQKGFLGHVVEEKSPLENNKRNLSKTHGFLSSSSVPFKGPYAALYAPFKGPT